MNFESFFDHIENIEIKVSALSNDNMRPHLLDNEVLFQLPLISLIVLLMAKDRRKPFVSELGRLVGESLEASMIGFKKSDQHLAWSANLRVRTVKAISFLEHTKLIEINNRKGRVKISELGKKVINKALAKDDNLSYNLSKIARAYRNICVSKQFDLEL